MLNILDQNGNPALGPLLSQLRHVDLQQDRQTFRRNMSMTGTLLAYEIAKSLEGKKVEIPTPLGTKLVDTLVESPILATALRAGIPFLDGMLEIFGQSDTMFFGAARAEGSALDASGGIKINLGYEALTNCGGRDVIFVDPMVATGSTIIDIYQRLLDRDQEPRRFIVAGLVGWRGAYDRIKAHIKNAEIWYVTCDEELNGDGYIVPGLGDAGDLCFGPKL